MAHDATERKKIFFDRLHNLHDSGQDETDEDEESERSVREFLHRGTRPSLQTTSSYQRSQTPSSPAETGVIQAVRTPLIAFKAPELVRSASAPTTTIKETPLPIPLHLQRLRGINRGNTPLSREVSFVEETPIPAPNRQPIRRFSNPTPSKQPEIQSTGSMLGKRKRVETSLVMVPEDRQIFRELKFFYLPNDDISPIRKARIKRAREYGATWMRVYGPDVTHMIIEESLTYKEVADFMKFSSVPEDVIIVSAVYPVDCVQFKRLLDPTSKRYLVSGYQKAREVSSKKSTLQASSAESQKSLELKPAKSNDQNLVTQSPSEASTQTRPDLILSQPERSTTPTKHGDELDEIMQETKKLEHFLTNLDEDVSSPSTPSSQDQGYSSDEHSPPERKPKAPRLKKKYSTNVPWQEKFSCMKGGNDEDATENPNFQTIKILQEMADYYDSMKDKWRPMAYRKAITILKQQTTKISTYNEAFALPFIGHRLAEKISEIARTNRRRRLDNTKLEPTDLIYQKFMNIYGVGHAQASKWIAKGYTTFSDLLTKAKLSENQSLGIKHYDDFLLKIPRNEITALGNIVKETAREIDSEVQIIIGGSYRRGAKESGDIDLIITKPSTTIIDLHPFLTTLISTLEKKKFIVAALAVSHREDGSKWHGACILPTQTPPIWRRIDFLLVPDAELGAALIYFTGNDIFNRSIRLLASKKGMRLNQRGLYRDVLRGEGREKMNGGELVEGRCERRIFEVLGVPWRRPEDRIC